MSADSARSDFTVYPAIDVRAGRVVRLRQGDYAQETRYADDPYALAETYATDGSSWLHLVDLDAARAGGYTLAPLLRQIKAGTSLRVQTGGGVRSAVDVDALLDAGADRVVIGSLSVRSPELVAEWIAKYGAERIVVALDTRADANGRWRLPIHGWTEVVANTEGVGLESMLAGYAAAGLRHLLCTDIARDGMLSGPNCDLYRQLHALAPGIAIQASGGVGDLTDLRNARAAGCAGAVLGRSLLEGRLTLAEALAC
jgi:phosphoribosylformimino-5-aminoimidazole carboxamide ribotide isomerase